MHNFPSLPLSPLGRHQASRAASVPVFGEEGSHHSIARLWQLTRAKYAEAKFGDKYWLNAEQPNAPCEIQVRVYTWAHTHTLLGEPEAPSDRGKSQCRPAIQRTSNLIRNKPDWDPPPMNSLIHEPITACLPRSTGQPALRHYLSCRFKTGEIYVVSIPI